MSTLKDRVNELLFPNKMEKAHTEALSKVEELLSVALDNGATDEKLSALGQIRSIVDAYWEYDSTVSNILDYDANDGPHADNPEKIRAAEQRRRKVVSA